MSAKRSITLEILVKLKLEIFAEETFTEFNFVIHDPTHRNLFPKNQKVSFTWQKRYYFRKKNIQKLGIIYKNLFHKI